MKKNFHQEVFGKILWVPNSIMRMEELTEYLSIKRHKFNDTFALIIFCRFFHLYAQNLYVHEYLSLEELNVLDKFTLPFQEFKFVKTFPFNNFWRIVFIVKSKVVCKYLSLYVTLPVQLNSWVFVYELS